MIFNTTEIDTAEPITEYKKEPTFSEAFTASMDNFTSVNLSSSEKNYYNEEKDAKKNEWINKNPNDKAIYERILSADKNIIEKLDNLYDDNKTDIIENWNTSTDSGIVNIGGFGIGKDYLRFREIQGQKGLSNTNDIRSIANNKALADYQDTTKVIEDSDHWAAELLGTMAGALQDPVTLATLPLGTFKTGGTIAVNAAKAFIEEAKIEAMAQAVIVPKVSGFKRELDIKTSIAEDAANALITVATAGLFRGVGSAAFDLTSKGISKLRVKDAELADEYEALSKTQATEDMQSHIENLHITEFSDGVVEIKNPNEKGIELNSAQYHAEVTQETINMAQEAKAMVVEGTELKIFSGVDEAGESIYKTHKELADEIDMEAAYIQKAKECNL